MNAIGSQPGPKNAGMNSVSVHQIGQLNPTPGDFPFLVHMGESGFRAWQVYLSGGSQTLLNGSAHVYRVYCQAK